MDQPLDVVLLGYSSVGAAAFHALGELGCRILAVVTHGAAPGEEVWFEPVARLAEAARIPVRLIGERWPTAGSELERFLAALAPDVFLSAYFRVVVPGRVLALPRRAAVNLHGSLLPRYRGRAPLNWAILRGERETGMTLHHMIEEPDAGDIVAQERLAIGPDETAAEVQLRLDDAARRLLLEHLPRLASGTAARTPQDPAAATCFGRRRPADGAFEWTWPARRIHDLVRAVTRPFPGAFALAGAHEIRVWRTRVAPEWDGPQLRPGERWSAPSGATFAGTGDGVLELVDYELGGTT